MGADLRGDPCEYGCAGPCESLDHWRERAEYFAEAARNLVEGNAWRQECWQILLETGADPDGDDPRHLNPGEALRAVRELLHEANLNDERERMEAEAIPEADRG